MVDLFHSLEELRGASPLFQKSAVAIGNFDGVHKGHEHILRLAAMHASASGAVAVALTFDPHPRAVVGDGAPPALATPVQRRALVKKLGIEAIVALRFDKTVADLSPEQFVEDVLVRSLGARHVIVGDNFRFGRRAQGTTQRLEELGQRFGYAVHVVSPVLSDGDVISSSLVRKQVSSGDVAAAARLLGRDYAVTGVVVRGEGRGQTLGFPTANIVPAAGLLLPGPGVYLARVVATETPVSGVAGAGTGREHVFNSRPALAIVSDKPTFGFGKTVLEVHVLDYDGRLQGRELSVRFLDRLRDVIRFDSAAQLQTQMRSDVETARQRFQADAVL